MLPAPWPRHRRDGPGERGRSAGARRRRSPSRMDLGRPGHRAAPSGVPRQAGLQTPRSLARASRCQSPGPSASPGFLARRDAASVRGVAGAGLELLREPRRAGGLGPAPRQLGDQTLGSAGHGQPAPDHHRPRLASWLPRGQRGQGDRRRRRAPAGPRRTVRLDRGGRAPRRGSAAGIPSSCAGRGGGAILGPETGGRRGTRNRTSQPSSSSVSPRLLGVAPRAGSLASDAIRATLGRGVIVTLDQPSAPRPRAVRLNPSRVLDLIAVGERDDRAERLAVALRASVAWPFERRAPRTAGAAASRSAQLGQASSSAARSELAINGRHPSTQHGPAHHCRFRDTAPRSGREFPRGHGGLLAPKPGA